jgi:tetraacyldisaccharide 4'-kinase
MNDMNTRKRMITRFQDALRPFSWVYGTAATLRRKLYAEHVREPKRLPCPTISIGNMTTGGTGKTPMTIYLAAFLWKAGLAPLIVSRGYRGSASADGGIVSDGRDILMDAGRSGDEPLLMAERLPHVPVAVGRKRYAIAMEAIRRFSPAVVLLDDGFQHFQLARDIDIVLLDYARPLGNNHLLPAGTLREPSTVLRQADIVVFTRSDKPGRPHSRHIQKLINDKPLFYACHIPIITHRISGNGIFKTADRPGLENLAGHCAYVFCGLADNRSFLDGIRRQGIGIAGYRFFRDHHAFTPADLAGIFRKARKSGADIMLTSGKDYVKFRDRMPPDFPCDLVVLDAAISFKDQAERFEELILTNIQNRL